MKKIFIGSTYLLMLVMMFTYMLIAKDTGNGNQNLLDLASGTGVSIIGFIFIFPAFVFTVLTLCSKNKMIAFCRDLFGLFSSAFCLATGALGIFGFKDFLYIPIILIVVTLILLVLSIVNVINDIKNEKQEA